MDLTDNLEVKSYGALTVNEEIPSLGELTISTHGRGDEGGGRLGQGGLRCS